LGPGGEQEGIYTGDARELVEAIPDESVDLIFTDPVYDRFDDYRWLAETCMRVLKPNSAALVWCGIGYLPETLTALREGGLHYKWQLAACRPTGFPSRHAMKNTFSNWQSLLWCEKGTSWPVETISDLVFSNDNGSMMYHAKWAKNIGPFKHWLKRFTKPVAIVADFFAGGGTVPAVAKMMGRRYLACEIAPELAERARQRVRNTQPPLFVPEEEQLEMSLEKGV
jgi:DNA modification methylase